MIQAIHVSVKGRARYRIPGLFRSDSLKKHIESKLNKRSGIERFSINTLTGNILVFFNSGQTHSDIALIIEGILANRPELKSSSYPAIKKKRNNLSQQKAPNPQPKSSQRVNIWGTGTARDSRRRVRRSVVHAEPQTIEQWHLMPESTVTALLKSDRKNGLPVEAAGENLKKFGPNILPESVPRSGFSIFINQFKSIPVALLGVAAVISVSTGGLADALVIMAVVGVNALIGYASESGTEKTIHSLKTLVRPSAMVVRDAKVREISSGDVVPGDLIVLRPGTYVTADARLIEADHLSVDESALTGESMPVTKTIPPILKDNNIPLAERTNMVYMGTLVTGGQGIAVVVGTGRFTEIGNIQTILGDAQAPDTPMERKLDEMGKQLVIVSGAVCGIVFFVGLLYGYGFLEMLKSSIALAVAAVPEGLPAVATTTLALGIRNMRKHNVLIRHLEAVETLGSVQTICLDKTGTLTMNRMSVQEIFTGSRLFRVSDGKFISDNDYVSPYACTELLMLIHVCILCNESEIIHQNGEYVVTGSPTENSFIHMAIEAGVDVEQLRSRAPLLKVIHRSEKRNVMLTAHSAGELYIENQASAGHKKSGKRAVVKDAGLKKILAVKGSPREVLDLCAWYMKDGVQVPLSDEDRLFFEMENEHMAGKAFRVLGSAYAYTDNKAAQNGEDVFLPGNFTWLGIIGLADPVRKGVKNLIEDFHHAGIDTVMITGDQSPTAYAVAKELDLSKGEQLEILDSRHLTDIPPDILKALCERVHVFARVSPSHKLQIVQSLQSAGKVIAMTGDGINDGPALKAADIGIAMGHTGTDVAREVADVILEDDNLQTMIIAVSHGRTIYNNIRKSVHFLLSTNMSEIMVMFTAITLGLGQPLNTMQLLWINLLSDIFPGLALALELPEPDVLSRPPRDPGEAIIKPSDFKRITFEAAVISAGALGSYGYGIMRYGIGPQASTLAFSSLTIGQLIHSLSCRSEHISMFSREKLPQNRYLNIALGGSFALQILAMTVPGIRGLLRLAPIGVFDGMVIGVTSLLPYFVNEATKDIRISGNMEAHAA